MSLEPRPAELYPRNRTPDLDLELFRTPTAEYRGAPFWAWNAGLGAERLARQIGVFKAMGMGGFHMHARTGLRAPYLGEAFMAAVRACVETARAADMRAWLYDEDRYPSGFAGGLVTRDPRFRAKRLRWSREGSGGEPLARFDVRLEHGRLAGYRRLGGGEAASGVGTVWHAFLETEPEADWYNGQTYVDTLSPEATGRFLELTHERYNAAVGQHFGGVVPAIFTDEPQFARKESFGRAEEARDLTIPWTTDFPASYQSVYGESPLESLPELFWEWIDGHASAHRYRYHDHLAERFSSGYADIVGAWCADHGLFLTGHLMDEPTLESQTAALGEAMRSYRGFGLPGIDVLCDSREYTTAKQAQSAARQYGRPGMLSELYGVTNWDFSFAGHKAQGDWQAALGVTVRVPHLAWLSMAGEAKRDYPASIGEQSPWWREYPLVEDHFARLNTVLTRGRPLVRVGVIHPIESFWLCFGPLEHTGLERETRERQFSELTQWLLFGLLDFDFIAESLLPSLCPEGACPLPVGEARYGVVVVPPTRTMRSSTVTRLEQFRDAGGELVFLGEVPSLLDAEPSGRVRALADRSRRLEFERGLLLEALEPWREVEAQLSDGRRADCFLYQARADGPNRAVFLCNTDREAPRAGVRVAVRGEWQATMMDTVAGETRPLGARLEADWTVLDWDFPPHGHLLVRLEPGRAERPDGPPDRGWLELGRLVDPVPVVLSEPNVLLLDRAEYRLNGEPWRPAEEMLRLDTALRLRLGWPPRTAPPAQPWTDPEPPEPTDTLELRFTVLSEVEVLEPSLALENAAAVKVFLDGRPVVGPVTGFFVDEAIETVRLPRLRPGRHELVLSLPYGRQTSLEWCYLLGDFGVTVRGRHARIVAPVRELAFGNWTHQGLPFYAGNVTYRCTLSGGGRELAVRASKFKAPLLSVALDGREAGKIAFAPYLVELGRLSGPHRLDITAFGNRVNAFGAVHNADHTTVWFGPGAWRTAGEGWADEYQLKPMGLLVAPALLGRP